MSKMSILIVEDEAIVAKDIQQSLKKSGYTVLNISSSGEQTLTLLKDARPNLILMDIMLKGILSGVDTAIEIKRLYNIPVIFLTAYADQSTLDRAKVSEPYGYIIKPFREVDLFTSIEIAIHKHSKNLEIMKERDLLFTVAVESKGDRRTTHFIKTNSRFVKLVSNDIWYVEALKDYVTIFTETDKFIIHSTMKEIERKLPHTDFARVHRSFIVNISKISHLENGVLFLEFNKRSIPIGGSHRDVLFKQLNLL